MYFHNKLLLYCIVLYCIGNIALNYGDFKAARVCFENELKEAKEAGDRDNECGAYTNLGIAYKSLGDFIKAAKCHQQVLSISKENGNRLSKECLRQPWQILSLSE